MAKIFLTAAWRKLVMANYPVDPAILQPLVPVRTELDTWQGACYVSLVGFQFANVRVKSFRVPYHTDFPEVNLRFYVRYRDAGQWKRGVVFVREIVPLRAVSWLANTLFHERYIRLPMRYQDARTDGSLNVGYDWKYRGRWNRIAVESPGTPLPLQSGSQEEFITEHFWGYARASEKGTGEYQVAHPRWELYPVAKYQIDCDFPALYGAPFADLCHREPQSVFLAEGSAVEVYSKKSI